MSCYPADIIEQPTLPDISECVVCHGIARDPVTDKEGHVFGRACIEELLQEHGDCPSENHPLSADDVQPIQMISRIVQKLKVKCVNYKKCDWKGIVADFDSHLQEGCFKAKESAVLIDTEPEYVVSSEEIEARENIPSKDTNNNEEKKSNVSSDLNDDKKSNKESPIKNVQHFDSITPEELMEASPIIGRKATTQLENLTEAEESEENEEQQVVPQSDSDEEIYHSSENQTQNHSSSKNDQSNSRKENIESQSSISQVVNQSDDDSIMIIEVQPGKRPERFLIHNLEAKFEEPSPAPIQCTPMSKKRVKITSAPSLIKQQSSTLNQPMKFLAIKTVSPEGKKKTDKLMKEYMLNNLTQHQTSSLKKFNHFSIEASFDSLRNSWPKQKVTFKQPNTRPLIDEESKDDQYEGVLVFDHTAKACQVSIDSNFVARNRGFGSLVLLNTRLVDEETIVVRLGNIVGKEFAIGCCIKPFVQKNHYEMPSGLTTHHGCFLVNSNGYLKVHGSKSSFPSDKHKFMKINSRNILAIKVSYRHKKLLVDNLSTESGTEIDLSNVDDFSNLYICVKFSQKMEIVELISPIHIRDIPLSFDIDPIKRSTFLLKGNTIIYSQNIPQNLVLLNEPVEPGKEYRFFIKRCQSKQTAIGLCFRAKTSTNSFELVQNSSNSYVYLISSSNDTLKHGSTKWQRLPGYRTLFGQSERVVLFYDGFSNVLVLKNETRRLESAIQLDINKKQLADLYPCVLLAGCGDTVELLNH